MEVKPIPFSPSTKWFLDWQHLEREMLLGFDLSQRSSDLLQNCDLPPPLKLFSPVEQDDNESAVVTCTISQQQNPSPILAVSKSDRWEEEVGVGHGEENANLLRALQLSQTRAREAEKKAAEERRRNEELMRLLVDDSLRLSAYRRWARLLEVEISLLQRKGLIELQKEESGDGGADVGTAAVLCFTLALCIGIAGVGFAVRRYVF